MQFEVIAVNQDEKAAVGSLVKKFSTHPVDAPEYVVDAGCCVYTCRRLIDLSNDCRYAWAVDCNGSDATQTGWSYDKASKQVKRNDQCLDGVLGKTLTLAGCGNVSKPGAQSWVLSDSRIWQADSSSALTEAGVGTIALAKCAAPALRPGQQWQYSLGAATTNVQVNLSTRMGGCWEITACATADGAGVRKNHELCIQNKESCIKNKEFCIKKHGVCI